MAVRRTPLDAHFQPIRGASQITGLSTGFIRRGCKDGSIPHLKVGNEYRINMPAFLKQLGIETGGESK